MREHRLIYDHPEGKVEKFAQEGEGNEQMNTPKEDFASLEGQTEARNERAKIIERLNGLGSELFIRAWTTYRQNRNEPTTANDLRRFVEQYGLDKKLLPLNLGEYLILIKNAEFIPARSAFRGRSLEVLRRVRGIEGSKIGFVEREGSFFVQHNGKEWELQMHPDSFQADDPARNNISRRLSLTRQDGEEFYHAYIRRDEFFVNYDRKNEKDGGPILLNEEEIVKAIVKAESNAEGFRSAEKTVKKFDLPKDAAIGFFAMGSEAYDPLLTPSNNPLYASAIAETLRNRGHDVRLPQEGKSYIETGNPEQALKRNVETLYGQGVRVFLIDLPVHGHGKSSTMMGAGMAFSGNTPSEIPEENRKELDRLQVKIKELEKKLTEAKTDEERKGAMKDIRDVAAQRNRIANDPRMLDANEAIQIINSFLARDPSVKFVFTSLACYGGGWMEKFQEEAQRNPLFRSNVSLFLEADGNQPGIPAQYRGKSGEFINFPSHFRREFLLALQDRNASFGEAAVKAKKTAPRHAEARPTFLVQGTIAP